MLCPEIMNWDERELSFEETNSVKPEFRMSPRFLLFYVGARFCACDRSKKPMSANGTVFFLGTVEGRSIRVALDAAKIGLVRWELPEVPVLKILAKRTKVKTEATTKTAQQTAIATTRVNAVGIVSIATIPVRQMAQKAKGRNDCPAVDAFMVTR